MGHTSNWGEGSEPFPKLPDVKDPRNFYGVKSVGASAEVEPLIKLRIVGQHLLITPGAARRLHAELGAALAQLPALFQARCSDEGDVDFERMKELIGREILASRDRAHAAEQQI